MILDNDPHDREVVKKVKSAVNHWNLAYKIMNTKSFGASMNEACDRGSALDLLIRPNTMNAETIVVQKDTVCGKTMHQ